MIITKGDWVQFQTEPLGDILEGMVYEEFDHYEIGKVYLIQYREDHKRRRRLVIEDDILDVRE